MNNAGDAAEQVVRLSIDGMEFVLRIAGSASKEVAAFLYAAFRDTQNQKPSAEVLRGREKLKTMLKTGKPTEIFSVKDADMKAFAHECKKYGVGFNMLRGRKKTIGGQCDLMVFQEDAPKIARILENMKILAERKAEIGHDEAGKDSERAVPVRVVQKDATDRLMDELLEKPNQKEKQAPENPAAEKSGFFRRRAEKEPPSRNSSGNRADTDRSAVKKEPVQDKLDRIQKQVDDKKADDKKKDPPQKSAPNKKKSKNKKNKGGRGHG